MTEPSPLRRHVHSLPELVRDRIQALELEVRRRITSSVAEPAARVFLTGCGDSHHACLAAELAFEELAGLPCEPMTAMQFARYAVDRLPESGPGGNLVIAVSVSGRVSRTAEALGLARRAGARAVAVTGDPTAPLAEEAELLIEATVPQPPVGAGAQADRGDGAGTHAGDFAGTDADTLSDTAAEQANRPTGSAVVGTVVPGVRSYVVTQLALYLCAIHLGELRGRLTAAAAEGLRAELAETADGMARTNALCDAPAADLARGWADADRFVWCGAGPNHGTAMFAAAKLLEASGDAASAMDTEEWAHLEYFARQADTPTFLIGAGGRDEDRAVEVAAAAKAVGRRVAIVAPERSALAGTPDRDARLPTAQPPRECFSPLITCIPGALFAAHRADVVGERYFRGFEGGRGVEGGGGASRIQTSHRIDRAGPAAGGREPRIRTSHRIDRADPGPGRAT